MFEEKAGALAGEDKLVIEEVEKDVEVSLK